MFACIFSRSVSETAEAAAKSVLIDLAFTFSPLVEEIDARTAVLDISGQNLLFGHPESFADSVANDGEVNSALIAAHEITRRGKALNLKINVAVAANADVAIHAARAFKGVTHIDAGKELLKLAPLSLKKIDPSLVGIKADRAAEIQETLALWGIRTFGNLAELPLAGLAQRLGQDGVRLQKLAQGKTYRK